MKEIKPFKIHSVTCRTNYLATSISDYFRRLEVDRINLQQHAGIEFVCKNIKLILEEKMNFISRAINEYDFHVSIVLGFSFINDEEDTISFELIVSDLQGRILGKIGELYFYSDELEFTITLKQLMEYEDMPLYKQMESIPAEEWQLYCSFFEKDKSFKTIKKIDSQIHLSNLYEPSDYMVDKIKKEFEIDEKITNFLYNVQSKELYDFSRIYYYESMYLFGFHNSFALCLKFKKTSHKSVTRGNNTWSNDLEYISRYFNIERFIKDFDSSIIDCLIDVNILHKELRGIHEEMATQEIFELSKLLGY